MSALKPMTIRQRERYRPRGVVSTTADTAMPSRGPPETGVGLEVGNELTLEEAVQRDQEIYDLYEGAGDDADSEPD